MSESEKPEGDLEDAEGVTTDSEGNPQIMMDVLEKGGSRNGDTDTMQKTKSDEE